jgi:hypothetical protein
MHVDLKGDKEAAMPPVDRAVESLLVWHCRYRTLAPLGALRRLKFLMVCPVPDGSLGFLASLKNLRELRIMHMPKVRDLAPLAELRRLEILGLGTLPSWDASGRVTEVRSLAPLAKLPSLKHLALFGVVSRSRSLKALEGCPKLSSVCVSKFPKAELKRFREASGIFDDDFPPPARDDTR